MIHLDSNLLIALAGASLATVNPTDFQPFVPWGFKLHEW